MLTDETFLCYSLGLGPGSASRWSTWLMLEGISANPIAKLSVCLGLLAIMCAPKHAPKRPASTG